MCAKINELYLDRPDFPFSRDYSEKVILKDIATVVERAIEDFRAKVTFTILEVLPIQSAEKSESRTFLFCDKNLDVNREQDKYFKVIDEYKKQFRSAISSEISTLSISRLDSLYFKKEIWMIEIDNNINIAPLKSTEKEWRPGKNKELIGYTPRGVGHEAGTGTYPVT